MKGKLVRNLSANVLQLVVNQFFGLVIFYVLSTGLDKRSFGQINLSLAVLLAAVNILSCGIDQLVVKKIAAGEDPASVMSLYLWHVVFTGLLFYLLFFAGYFLLPGGNYQYGLILLIAIGKLMFFFSTPFKQVTNGLEQFRLLAYMSVISNIVRGSGLVLVLLLHDLNMFSILVVFTVGDTVDLLLNIYLFKKATKIKLSIKWDKLNYLKLLKEALPQTGVVLITSALARFDWIFIGFMISAEKLAEYSFAYKAFEISTLPLLAIAPLLIPRFTKMFGQTDMPVEGLRFLIRTELIVAAFIGLVLNICWSPVINALTSGKYGSINVVTIFILSLCMPLLYLNNFLWTIYFAQGRLKMILNSFIFTFFVNVAGDLLLIPFFKNEGAAFAFLLACLVQTIYYLRQNTIADLNRVWISLVICTVFAVFSGFICRTLTPTTWIALPAAMIIYIFLLFISSQLKPAGYKALSHIFN